MSAIVHLIGFPAAGTYPVARALASAAEAKRERFVVSHNHLTGNVILSVIDTGDEGIVPDIVWDRVGEVREVLYRAIVELSPPRWSFVFTNVLIAGDQGDEAVVARLARLAAESGRVYVPVHVWCELDSLLARVESPERIPLHKWSDPGAVRRFVEGKRLADINAHAGALSLDTTERSPQQSAHHLLEHVRLVAQGDPTR